jgi:osmoprotectant transport system ATP-binding protein|tara:strand:- start:233 stop:958 length:726 start_codon:yes stop_codon:yes gene_type:complete
LSEYAIEFESVNKSYKQEHVVDDVSLALSSGKTTAIVGESGSGKSTLLQIANGLVLPDSGQVRIDDQSLDYQNLPNVRRGMGYAVQGAGLFPHLTIKQNVTLVAMMSGWSKSRINERYSTLLSFFGLDDELSDRYPHSLSGGQQQRVGLCRAMMLEPPLLLLDEPFSALDPITRASIHEEMLRLKDVSILLVTHDMTEAARLAEHLVILKDGQVVQQGSFAQITSEPANDYVSLLIGSGNV